MVPILQTSLASKIYALVLVLVGLGVFAIRFQHAGPYSMPTWGPMLGALGCLSLGGVLLWSAKPKWLTWVAVLLSPLALNPALFSIGGEAEEVISVFAKNKEGEVADLRLWIVDRDDGAWVGLGKDKALAHNLNGVQAEMLRDGQLSCVMPRLHEDRPTVEIIHRMKVEKYTVAKMSGALGLYPLEATSSTVAVRLDPC